MENMARDWLEQEDWHVLEEFEEEEFEQDSSAPHDYVPIFEFPGDGAVPDDSLGARLARIAREEKTEEDWLINSARLDSYWEIGREIYQEIPYGHTAPPGGYSELSKRLKATGGKLYTVKSLKRAVKLYQCFPWKGQVDPRITWEQYADLCEISDRRERKLCMDKLLEDPDPARNVWDLYPETIPF
jgi:hypothetical protein